MTQSNIKHTASSNISLTSLQVENQDAPLGINVVPRFSWKIVSTEGGIVQASYQIRVSTVEPGRSDAWNSSVVKSASTHGIAYRGRPLQADTLYYWSVIVSTSAGTVAASSTFTTGFLAASDWAPSVWISKTDSAESLNLTQSTWIWTSEGGRWGAPVGDRPFRKTFITPSGKSAVSANIIITVDDGFKLFVNGDLIGVSPHRPDIWKSAQCFSAKLLPDSNVFAVLATNLADRNSGGPTPAGLLVAIRVNYVDGSSSTLYSDYTWRTIASQPPAGFEQPGFKDKAWRSASIGGSYGVSPWYTEVTVEDQLSPNIFDASWVWTREMGSGLAPVWDRPFRKTFVTPEGKRAVSADIIIAVDDGYQLYVNGDLIGSSPNRLDAWKSAQRFNATLLPDFNVFAVRATNLADRHYGGDTPAGMLVAIRINYVDGSFSTLYSDFSWLTIAWHPPPGFEHLDFDDSSWEGASTIGKYGVAPWRSEVIVEVESTPTVFDASWVWTSEMRFGSVPGCERPFRKRFMTPSGKVAVSADIVITVDDGYLLYVNGALVGSSPNRLDVWKEAQRFRGIKLLPELNVFAVRATNLVGRNSGGPTPAGLLVAIQINYSDGSSSKIYSDSTWRTMASHPPAGFEQPNFDDNSWSSVSTIGRYGVGPWWTLVRISEALAEYYPSPLLRKEFLLKQTVSWARLYYSVTGQAHITLNDEPVSDHDLAVTEGRAVALDVNSQLVLGNNSIGAELRRSATEKGEPALRLVLSIGYVNGTTERVVSDASWDFIDGPPSGDTSRLPGYETAGFDSDASTSTWRAVQVMSN